MLTLAKMLKNRSRCLCPPALLASTKEVQGPESRLWSMFWNGIRNTMEKKSTIRITLKVNSLESWKKRN